MPFDPADELAARAARILALELAYVELIELFADVLWQGTVYRHHVASPLGLGAYEAAWAYLGLKQGDVSLDDFSAAIGDKIEETRLAASSAWSLSRLP